MGDAYQEHGWLHIPGGATPEFLQQPRTFCHQQTSEAVLHGVGIRGSKSQYLYEPPDKGDALDQLRQVGTALGGLDGDNFTLAERHIKHYEPDADPFPVAHKDRLASQMAIGVSIEVAEGSHLVLYPSVDREVNPFLTADLRESLTPDRDPEVVLRNAPAVEVHDQPGDVIVFPGNSVWHLRRHSANTINLYFKCNDFGCDPLAEDPSTDLRSKTTQDLIGTSDADIMRTFAVSSRRVEWMGRLRCRDGVVRSTVKLWDHPMRFVTEDELTFLEDLASGTPLALDKTMAAHAISLHQVTEMASGGIIDLIADRDGTGRNA
jgi:hypothetical protein